MNAFFWMVASGIALGMQRLLALFEPSDAAEPSWPGESSGGVAVSPQAGERQRFFLALQLEKIESSLIAWKEQPHEAIFI